MVEILSDIAGGKRKAPPKAEKLVDHHLDAVKGAVAKYPGHPLVLAGKSMGSRYYSLCLVSLFNRDIDIFILYRTNASFFEKFIENK